jgi:hypothetical protein
VGGWTSTAADQALRGLLAASAKRPELIKSGMRPMLPASELALFEEQRFDGFFENLGEMVETGSKGAYWDAPVFLGDWGFECGDIDVPVSGADRVHQSVK